MTWKAVLLSAALMFGTAGIGLAAQTSGTATKSSNSTASTSATSSTERIHHEMGTVDSMTGSQLVISRNTKNNKQENVTFMLEPSTKKTGTIDKGTHVEVYYKTQNNQHVATEVKAEAAKS